MSNVISKLEPKYIVLFFLLQIAFSSYAETIYIPATTGEIYETPIIPFTITGNASSGYNYKMVPSFGFSVSNSYFCPPYQPENTVTLSDGRLALTSYSTNSDFYLIPSLYGTYSFFKTNEDTQTTYTYELKDGFFTVMDENGNEISQKNNAWLCGITFPNNGYNLKPNSKITMTVQGTWTLWRHSLSSSSTQFNGNSMGRFFYALLFKENSVSSTKLTMSDSFLPFRNDIFKVSNIDCNLVMPTSIEFGSVSIKNTSANKLVATENMPFSVSCEQDPNLYINSNIFISFSTNSRYLNSQQPNRLLLKRTEDDKPVSVVGEWSNNGESKQPSCDNTITDSTILFNGQKTYSVGSLLSSEQNKTFDLSIVWGLCTQNNNSYSTGPYSGYTTVNVLIK